MWNISNKIVGAASSVVLQHQTFNVCVRSPVELVDLELYHYFKNKLQVTSSQQRSQTNVMKACLANQSFRFFNSMTAILRFCFRFLKTVLKAWFPLVLRIVRIGDSYDFPILGFLQLFRFLGQPAHSSEESPIASGIYL